MKGHPVLTKPVQTAKLVAYPIKGHKADHPGSLGGAAPLLTSGQDTGTSPGLGQSALKVKPLLCSVSLLQNTRRILCHQVWLPCSITDAVSPPRSPWLPGREQMEMWGEDPGWRCGVGPRMEVWDGDPGWRCGVRTHFAPHLGCVSHKPWSATSALSFCPENASGHCSDITARGVRSHSHYTQVE